MAAAATRTLAGKVALVTGSSSGIGLWVARVLASKGADMVVHGIADQEELDGVVKDIADAYGVRCVASRADMLGGEEPIRELVNMGTASFGKSVDILVNNAGVQHVCPIEEFELDAWERIMTVSLTAAFLATKAALPAMRKARWGRIINIASAHGVVGSANKSAYVASKHGLLGLTKVTALENPNNGVTANAINPGWVLTPLVEAQIRARAESSGRAFEDEADDLLREKQPQRKFTTPEQLGELAAFLSSNAAENLTGAAIAMDGGWTAV